MPVKLRVEISSAGDTGLQLTRYADEVVGSRGNKYSEVYAGLNGLFYGRKLKWQSGLEYDALAQRRRRAQGPGSEYQCLAGASGPRGPYILALSMKFQRAKFLLANYVVKHL